MKPKLLSEQFFNDHYKVVGEHIEYATLYELEDHTSHLNHKKDVIHNEDYDNNYWAIVCMTDDGDYDDTLYDNFESADEAWEAYDKLKRRLCKGTDEPEYDTEFEREVMRDNTKRQLAEGLDLMLEDLAFWTHNTIGGETPVIFRNDRIQKAFAEYVKEYSESTL